MRLQMPIGGSALARPAENNKRMGLQPVIIAADGSPLKHGLALDRWGMWDYCSPPVMAAAELRTAEAAL